MRTSSMAAASFSEMLIHNHMAMNCYDIDQDSDIGQHMIIHMPDSWPDMYDGPYIIKPQEILNFVNEYQRKLKDEKDERNLPPKSQRIELEYEKDETGITLYFIFALDKWEKSGANPITKPVVCDPNNTKRCMYCKGPINLLEDEYIQPSENLYAHKECHQFLIAASGSYEVVLDDGINKRTVLLNRPFYGLHVPPGIWAEEQGFSSGSICLVLASEGYSESDYIRDYNDFLEYRKEL